VRAGVWPARGWPQCECEAGDSADVTGVSREESDCWQARKADLWGLIHRIREITSRNA
jgi:hypothetical protein